MTDRATLAGLVLIVAGVACREERMNTLRGWLAALGMLLANAAQLVACPLGIGTRLLPLPELGRTNARRAISR